MAEERGFLARYRGSLTFAGAALLVVGLALVAFAVWPREDPSQFTADRYAALEAARAGRSDVRGEPAPASVTDREVIPPTPEAPKRYDAAISSIRIERIGVDAKLVTMGLLPDGTMASPPRPDVVAYYDFTTKPGLGGNAVLSGHLDYRNYGPAVFANLKKLAPGDAIEIFLADGTIIEYEVTALKQYPVELVPMREVLAESPDDTLTLITCAGTFSGGQYSDRLVLRAAKTGVVASAQ
ncbi:MAG: class F sortase [Chloroflexi bacterium]|nr:class F sortase [Chloroflexota bacterium]